MCDYCSCRSDPEIAVLSAEHAHLGELAATVEQCVQAGNVTAARVTLADLTGLLATHTAQEEGGLFAELLAADELTDAVGARCVEHDEIADAFDAAGCAPCDEWPAAARAALRLLASHIWTEETDVFPAAALALPAIAFAHGPADDREHEACG